MKGFLSERGVEYAVRDVVADPEALAEFLRLGAPLPPVVAVGDSWVAGYDPDRLEALLEEGADVG